MSATYMRNEGFQAEIEEADGPDELVQNIGRLVNYWMGTIRATAIQAADNVWEDYVQPLQDAGLLGDVTYEDVLDWTSEG